MKTNTIHTGDVYDELPKLPAESVHTVMTSPPYWNLRDYGEDDQLGLEETPEEFVENLADVFDEVKRVLRPDGSLWLNLGDTYDDKDLQQIPARVALELQSRGWILRNRVTWAKPNPMPQSVKDRLNDTTEAVFHFVKNKDYWYDLDAIREAHAESTMDRGAGSDYSTKTYTPAEQFPEREPHNQEASVHPAGKNPGDVFEVTTKPFPDAHFAVYPPELCAKPIKATAPPKGSPRQSRRRVPGSTPSSRTTARDTGRRVFGTGPSSTGSTPGRCDWPSRSNRRPAPNCHRTYTHRSVYDRRTNGAQGGRFRARGDPRSEHTETRWRRLGSANSRWRTATPTILVPSPTSTTGWPN